MHVLMPSLCIVQQGKKDGDEEVEDEDGRLVVDIALTI